MLWRGKSVTFAGFAPTLAAEGCCGGRVRQHYPRGRCLFARGLSLAGPWSGYMVPTLLYKGLADIPVHGAGGTFHLFFLRACPQSAA
jgi:hypothetical protein